MKITVNGVSPRTVKADLLAVFLWQGGKTLPPEITALDKALSGNIKALKETKENKGRSGQVSLIHTFKKLASPRLLVVGLGKTGEFDLDKIRSAGVKIMGQARELQAKKIAVVMPEITPVKDKPVLDKILAAQALVEGLGYANWVGPRFQKKVKKEDIFLVSELLLILPGQKQTQEAKAGLAAVQRSVQLGQLIAETTNLARDFIETPGNLLTPEIFAGKAKALAQEAGLKISVLDEKQIKILNMGAFLSVSQGSANPPRIAVLEYPGTPAKKGKSDVLAFVGKGITFDSGGISLKPARKMSEMKTDMSGAAAVLAVMKAIAKLKPAEKILGIIPLAENMPSGTASRPGDVVKAMDGQSIEIITTDAEGRMIMADALLYAKKLGATKIIDLATLTGACVVALGDVASGIMGNDKPWLEQVKKAAAAAGEKVWELPLYPEYEEYIKCEIADMKNATEEGKAGTSKGGTFLKRFVGKTPWVHIDIAGTAYLDSPRGWRLPGPTGVGVGTLIYLLAGN